MFGIRQEPGSFVDPACAPMKFMCPAPISCVISELGLPTYLESPSCNESNLRDESCPIPLTEKPNEPCHSGFMDLAGH